MNQSELLGIKKRTSREMNELLKEKEILEFRPNETRIIYVEARIKHVQVKIDLIKELENR